MLGSYTNPSSEGYTGVSNSKFWDTAFNVGCRMVAAPLLGSGSCPLLDSSEGVEERSSCMFQAGTEEPQTHSPRRMEPHLGERATLAGPKSNGPLRRE